MHPTFGQQHTANDEWAKEGLHKLLYKIILKYNDTKWKNKDDHIECIYYSIHILGSMALASKYLSQQIWNLKPDIACLFCKLLQRAQASINWFEQRTISRTLEILLITSPNNAFRFVNCKPNIITSLSWHICTCITRTISDCCLVPKYIPKYQTKIIRKMVQNPGNNNLFFPHMHSEGQREDNLDLVNYIMSLALNWMDNSKLCLQILSQSNNFNVIKLFNELRFGVWDMLLERDICWIFMGTDWMSCSNIFDVLCNIIQYKDIAYKISQSTFIIQGLIIKLRCRCIFEWRIELVIYYLLKYAYINSKYYYDLCISLLSFIEFNRDYEYTLIISPEGVNYNECD
eukprot:47818_1